MKRITWKRALLLAQGTTFCVQPSGVSQRISIRCSLLSPLPEEANERYLRTKCGESEVRIHSTAESTGATTHLKEYDSEQLVTAQRTELGSSLLNSRLQAL